MNKLHYKGKFAITHGMSRTKEYRKYIGAKVRCHNSKHPRFKFYGGRGIKFLFPSFVEFFRELGKCPKGLTLDRIDTNGHYEQGNVRWATQSVQVSNRREYTWAKSIAVGAYWHKTAKKWMATIYWKRKTIYLGLHKTKSLALATYRAKKEELYGSS